MEAVALGFNSGNYFSSFEVAAFGWGFLDQMNQGKGKAASCDPPALEPPRAARPPMEIRRASVWWPGKKH